jgi:hypothetical protein
MYCCDRGREREWDGDYFVAGLYACCKQRQMQSAGPGVHRDRMLHTAVRGECALKLFHVPPENELSGIENVQYGPADLIADGVELGLQVGIGDQPRF